MMMVFSKFFRALSLCKTATRLVGFGVIFGLSGCGQGASIDERVEAARKRNDGPAIWKVTDVDSTLYLYGTMHVLKEGTDWQRPDMAKFFSQSGTVFFESPSGPDTDRVADLFIAREGVYRNGQTLLERLNKYQLALLRAASLNLDVPINNVQGFKPWMASDILSLSALEQAGYLTQLSVETELKSRARTLGKYRRYLESVEDSLSFMSNLSEADQILWFEKTMKGLNDLPDQTDRMVAAWRIGDTVKLEQLILSEIDVEKDVFYKGLVQERNRLWTQTLEENMSGQGTGFAAVGILHLIGEHSLQVNLEDKGYKVERVYDFLGKTVIKPIEVTVNPKVEDIP